MSDGRILVVDDEDDIRNLISAYLQKEDLEVFEARDGLEAIRIAENVKPDIIVLDIMLPIKNGLDVLSNLRNKSDVYVILLTAKAEEVDKLVGLNMGADDYLTKPFSPRELVARVNAGLRRLATQINVSGEGKFCYNDLSLDETAHRAWVNDEELDLTVIEFNLLRTLMAHEGQVLTREQLLDYVWGSNYFGDTRVVDVHIGNVRRKLGGRYITTVWGIGYRFEDTQDVT